MRIGTWNLAGRWDHRHDELVRRQNCDVWLLTEVNDKLSLDGWNLHAIAGKMSRGQRWAAVLSREPLVALPDPHPVSALARVGKLHFCSSILPWRGSGVAAPWIGTSTADKTDAAVRTLLQNLPREGLVWGGDWNHALSGREYSGSQAGRRHILAAISELGLTVPTATLPHHLPAALSIDHIAIPKNWKLLSANRVEAVAGSKRLSDHDAYVVEGE